MFKPIKACNGLCHSEKYTNLIKHFCRKKWDCFDHQTKALIVCSNLAWLSLQRKWENKINQTDMKIGNASIGLRHLHSLLQRLAPAIFTPSQYTVHPNVDELFEWDDGSKNRVNKNKSHQIKEENLEWVLKYKPILMGRFNSAWWQQDWKVTLLYLIANSGMNSLGDSGL